MPTTPSIRRSRAEWEQLMSDYENGSLSQRAFCDQHDVAYSSFCYWRKQLRMPVMDAPKLSSLIELPALMSDTAPNWRIELDLGAGMILRIR
jgi:hypothetical protein